MSIENLLKMVTHGEMSGTDEDITLEFAGQTWHVSSTIGDNAEMLVLLEAKSGVTNPIVILRKLIRAAAATYAAMGMAGNLAAHHALHMILEDELAEAKQTFAAAAASRGKPS